MNAVWGLEGQDRAQLIRPVIKKRVCLQCPRCPPLQLKKRRTGDFDCLLN
jgi:hypothetical protein